MASLAAVPRSCQGNEKAAGRRSELRPATAHDRARRACYAATLEAALGSNWALDPRRDVGSSDRSPSNPAKNIDRSRRAASISL
jgi:hypothetical protein